jgi:hypothetical protein
MIHRPSLPTEAAARKRGARRARRGEPRSGAAGPVRNARELPWAAHEAAEGGAAVSSEQIEKLNLMVAKNGKALPDGCHEAILLMNIQMLGEIAFQLAVLNEREMRRR